MAEQGTGQHGNDCTHGDKQQECQDKEGEGIHIACDDEEEFEDTSDPEELKKLYDDWSNNYEQDVGKMNYNAPRKVAEALAKIMTDKDADILDIGCCTGLVGQELYKVGYRNIDGIDISDECIKIAMAKNVYRKIVNEIIDPEKQMSFQSCSYDVVMLVGGGMFLDIKNLKEWLRLTKKDGFTIIGVMQSEYENEKYAVPQTIEEYIDQGLATRVSKDIVPDYITGKPGVVEYLRPVIKEQ